MDNLLVYLIQSFNYEALNILVEKYRKNLSSWIKEIINGIQYVKEVDMEYLICEAEIVLYKAIEQYNPEKGVFYSYLKGCVHNSVMNYIRYNQRTKIYALSLDWEIESDLTLKDSLSSTHNMTKIVRRYEIKEELDVLTSKINKYNSSEQQIFYLKMQGYTSEQISKLTEINVRKVNYLLNKIKKS